MDRAAPRHRLMFVRNNNSIIANFTSPGEFFSDCLSRTKVVSMDIFNRIISRQLSPEMVMKRSSQRFANLFSRLHEC